MKNNIKKYIVWFSAVFTAVIVLAVFKSCQSPIEPDITVEDVAITIMVKDQSNNLLANTTVKYSELPDGDMKNFSNGRTSNSGKLTDIFSVGAEGKEMQFLITPPEGYFYFDEDYNTLVDYIDDTLSIPCNDTILEFIFYQDMASGCEAIEDITVQLLSLCYEEQEEGIVWSPLFMPTCETAEVSVTDFTTIEGATLLLRKNFNEVSNGFTLNLGESFQVGMKYDTEKKNKPLETDVITVTLTPNGVPADRFVYTNISFFAESSCSDCECGEDVMISDSLTHICIGNLEERTVDLREFINTNEACRIILSHNKDFSSETFTLLSFNNDNYIIDPGEALQDMDIEVDASEYGLQRDTVIYNISLQNTETNVVTECENVLAIEVVIFVDASECGLEYKGFEYTSQSPVVDTLLAGIGTTSEELGENTTTLCIVNKGDCPFEVTDAMFKMSDGSPSIPFVITPAVPFTIDENSSKCIYVSFIPKEEDVYPNGRDQEGKYLFDGSLKIITSSQVCELVDINVTGKVSLPHQHPDELYESDEGELYHGLFFQTDGTVISGTEEIPNFAIYCTDIDVENNTAIIKRGSVAGRGEQFYVNMKVIGKNWPLPIATTTLCADLKTVYPDPIADIGMGDDPITVELGDVLALHYQFSTGGLFYSYYTYIVVRGFDYTTGLDPQKSKILISICSGL